MSYEQAILLTLVLYKVVLVGIGVVTSRRSRGGSEFFIGNRRLGPWVAAISAAASSSSVWTLLGVSGMAYQRGLSAVWIFPGCVGGFILNWYGLAPRLRRLAHQTEAITVTDLMCGPKGTPLRFIIKALASLIILFSFSFYVASQYQGAGKTFSATFGMSAESSILLGAGIVLLYTMLGGFWAVSLTDTLQGLVMALAALALPIAAVMNLGGPSEFVRALSEVDIPGYAHWTGDAPLMTSLGFVFGFLGIGLGYPGQPHVVNRLMAIKDERALHQGRRIAVGWAVLVYAGMLIVGWAGRIVLEGLSDQEQVFIAATHELFPPVFAGIILAGALSAMMSTADSQLLVAASSVTHDLNLGGKTDRTLVLRSRLVIVALSLGAVGLALSGKPEIFSKVLFAWSALGSAFGPILLVRIFGPIRPGHVLGAMFLGFSLSVVFYSLEATKGSAIERVVPFLIALIIARLGRYEEKKSTAR